MKQCIFACLVCVNFFFADPGFAHDKHVTLVTTPGQGIQPQAMVDAQGNLHLLYFHGEAGSGNLEYVRRDAGKTEFSKPLRVNSQEGSAIAIGTIRGGHLAVGKSGRVHVSWNGSSKALPKNPIAGSPMLYARLNNEGTAFEPQRNLMTKSAILDGGGSLAADALGNVYVAWHGVGEESAKGEDNRKVWISMSRDDGKTFAAEKTAWDEVRLDNWKIESCPMSRPAFTRRGKMTDRSILPALGQEKQHLLHLRRSQALEVMASIRQLPSIKTAT